MNDARPDAAAPPRTDEAKQRWIRIRPDYHKHGDRQTRRVWIVLAGVIVLVALFALMALLPRNRTWYSPGELSLAHAPWDQDCSVCHQSFQPIRADSIFAGNADALAGIDERCQSCHPGSPHHADQLADASFTLEKSCTSCHFEHHGRQHDLNRVDDRTCTACHADLDAFRGEDNLGMEAAIRGFGTAEGGHPTFRSLEDRDPGTVKFDHVQHMRPGQVDPGQAGAMRLEDIPEAWRGRYEEKSTPEGLVQLDCDSCHDFDQLGTQAWDLADAKPIRFDQHCAACHQLEFDAENFDPAPHGMEWDELERYVVAAYAGKILDEETENPPRRRLRQIPGRNRMPDEALAERLDERVEALARPALDGVLRTQCALCHDFDRQDRVERMLVSDPGSPGLLIPQRFFQHARFNHAPHLQMGMDCSKCHVGTTAGQEGATTGPANDHNNIMIENQDSCIDCHSPARRDGTETYGIAGSQCIECHQYHVDPVPDTWSTDRLQHLFQ